MSAKNDTPRFSLRASALAAPKNADPTISPRATSSDHSTGALNRKRASTEPHTTTRSARRRTAAIASLSVSSDAIVQWRPMGAATPDIMRCLSGLRRADHVDHGFRLGTRLDEIV